MRKTRARSLKSQNVDVPSAEPCWNPPSNLLSELWKKDPRWRPRIMCVIVALPSYKSFPTGTAFTDSAVIHE